MITYPLAIPDNQFVQSAAMSMEFAVGLTESPFSYSSQVFDWGGARWRYDFSLPIMKRDDAEEWIAFALALRGMKGTFLAGDPSGKVPRGTGGGTPLVNGAGQTGSTLVIDGAPPYTFRWLKKGDYFQIGTGINARLYKLIIDVEIDSGGGTTLEFVPNLRGSPADNAPIIINDAKGLFRMSSNQVPWTADASGKIFHFSFSALEAL